MNAVVVEGYGFDHLRIADVDTPVCGDDQLLIRVRAASVNARDPHLVTGRPLFVRLILGLRRPKISRPGTDVAGVVEAIGRNVTRFKVGDEVFGVCRGAFAEWACIAESNVAAKPPNVSFEQAAAIPVAGMTALQALRAGGAREGSEVLINGVTGGVGSFAVQLAQAMGAKVFTAQDRRYDVIVDCYSNRSLFTYKRMLKPDGRCIIVGGPIKSLAGLLLRFLMTLLVPRVTMFMAKKRTDDLAFVAGLVAAGKIVPVIDKRFALNETRQALEYVAAGHTRGKTVIIP